MRKQNSTFKTSFISEAGSELRNHDYFAFVELEKYGCYVIADGLGDLPAEESAKLAVQTILLAFQEHPSMRKGALRSYLEKANRALERSDAREKQKASVMAVVTDYASIRYGYGGNTRLRLYRNGMVKEQTQDMSMGRDLVTEKELSQDVLARHEERNNLYAYLGQGKGFCPRISRKIKLENGDILALYTRGIWENIDSGELDDVFSQAKDDPKESLDLIEDLLLSKQPKELENYTFAAVFADKVYLDPNQKRRRKRLVSICISLLLIALAAGLILWFLIRRYRMDREEMERRYTNTIEYIQDTNFVRAGEECAQALALAEKLKRKKEIQDISDYQKLIEALTAAEEVFGKGDYEAAQSAYVTAKERSRYADRIADGYIDGKLSVIVDYLEVFDYIQLGDALSAQGDYDRAEAKYLQAKSLATRTYFQEGRQDALDALSTLYESRKKAEEAENQEAKERAVSETGAAQLAAEGDKAFGEGDYAGANGYYVMALEKYQAMGDEAHAQMIREKMAASGQKSGDNQEKERQAEEYILAARVQEELGQLLEAKKQYLFAKNLYKELKKDDKVQEVEGLLELLELKEQEEEAEAGKDTEPEGAGAAAGTGAGAEGTEPAGTGAENRPEAAGTGAEPGTGGTGEAPKAAEGAGLEMGPGFAP